MKQSIKRSKNQSQESHISHVHYSSKRGLPKKNPSTISYHTFEIITCQEEKHISIFNNRI